jgi:ribosomal protein L37AE/L43A
MKIFEKLFEHLLAPVLVIIFTPIATIAGSKLTTNNWTQFIEKIPSWIIYTFFVVIIIWFVIILIRKRLKVIEEDNYPILPFISRTPIYGYENIGQLKYARVKWNILHPANPTWVSTNINPNDIEVDTPPICPDCNTEIKEMKNFWGKYVWSCVKCGFKTKSKLSYWIIEEDIKKIAKSEIIRFKKEKRK